MKQQIKTLAMLAICLLASISSMADNGNANENSQEKDRPSSQVHVTIRSTKPRPRSILPEFNACLVGDTINTSIKYYTGDVEVYVSDQSNIDYISEVHHVYGQYSFAVDVSTLTTGNYTIYYVMGDGTVYGGDFSIAQ